MRILHKRQGVDNIMKIHKHHKVISGIKPLITSVGDKVVGRQKVIKGKGGNESFTIDYPELIINISIDILNDRYINMPDDVITDREKTNLYNNSIVLEKAEIIDYNIREEFRRNPDAFGEGFQTMRQIYTDAVYTYYERVDRDLLKLFNAIIRAVNTERPERHRIIEIVGFNETPPPTPRP